jgi:hypothetical protein
MSPIVRIVHVFLLVTSLLTGTGLNVFHDHHEILASGGTDSLLQHSCGSREIHKPIGDASLCPVCSRIVDRVPSVAILYSLFPLQGMSVVVQGPEISAFRIPYSNASKRGPPSFS